MRARRARAADAAAVYALIAQYVEQGLLLPRTEAEITEHIERFLLLTDLPEGEGKILGCVALEPYGSDLAEIRSLAVAPEMQGRGLSARLMQFALATARRRKIARVFAVTHRPEVFARHGFSVTPRQDVPEKIARDCAVCPKQSHCELVAAIAVVCPERIALPVLPAPAKALSAV